MTNLIVDGLDYSDYDSEELKRYKNDYFNNNLMEMALILKCIKFFHLRDSRNKV